jgi:hypothetical protein
MLQQSASVQVYIPTSRAVDVARRVARDLGFDVANPEYYFDLMLTRDGKPPIVGYVSMGLYGHDNLIETFAISEKTGQVVEPAACQVFEFSNLVPFQKAQQRQSGLKSKTQKELMSDFGCERLTVVRSPLIVNNRPARSEK